MTTFDYPSLRQFLGGYFHQDWAEESSSPLSVVKKFIQNEPKEFVDAVLAEVDGLIEECRESREPARLLFDLGCYFDPRSEGLSIWEWLETIRGQLRNHQ